MNRNEGSSESAQTAAYANELEKKIKEKLGNGARVDQPATDVPAGIDPVTGEVVF